MVMSLKTQIIVALVAEAVIAQQYKKMKITVESLV